MMAERTLKLEIQNTDKVKTLIELLGRHFDDLPNELQLSLKEVADCDTFELGYDQINFMINRIDKARGHRLDMSGEFKLIADGEEIKHTNSINPIVKSVTYTDYEDGNPKIKGDSIVLGKCYPYKMKMTYRDVTLAEW